MLKAVGAASPHDPSWEDEEGYTEEDDGDVERCKARPRTVIDKADGPCGDWRLDGTCSDSKDAEANAVQSAKRCMAKGTLHIRSHGLLLPASSLCTALSIRPHVEAPRMPRSNQT